MKRRTKLKIWLVVGILLALTPILGTLPTVVGMIAAFNDVNQTQAPEQALSEAIGLGLNLTAAGLVLCPIGLLIVVVSIVKLRQGDDESRRQTG